jgi:hypothetical protein
LPTDAVFIEGIGGHNMFMCNEMSGAGKETSGSYLNNFYLDASEVEDKYFGSFWSQQRV